MKINTIESLVIPALCLTYASALAEDPTPVIVNVDAVPYKADDVVNVASAVDCKSQ